MGQAIKNQRLARHDVWVTTKWSSTNEDKKAPTEALEESLRKLGLDYVDLYLIHTPLGIRDRIGTIWGEFERILESGKAKSIGVSK